MKVNILRKSLVFSGIFLFGVLQFASDAFASPTSFFVDPKYDQLGRRSIEATLRVVSEKALFYVEEDFFARADLGYRAELERAIQNLAKEFDETIFSRLQEKFGSAGIAADKKLTIFLYRARPDIGGYFDWRNLESKERYQFSNSEPMVYLNVYRVTHPAARAYLAHEFQHLVTYYQKNARKNMEEEVWLDELYSEYAPTVLGYNKEWNGSYIESRVYDFGQNVQNSILGWSGNAADQGAVALFAEFLAGQYGEQVILDAFHSPFVGVDSIEYALNKNGFKKKFWEVFNQWLVANVVNNSIKMNEFYAYQEPLTYDHFHVLPEVNFRVGNQEINFALTLEDWASAYIRVTPISLGASQILEIRVQNALSLENIDVKIPYIINYFSGNTDVGYAVLKGKNASIFVNGFGKEVNSVVLIPTSQKSLAGFTSDGLARAVSLRMNFSATNPQTVSDLIISIQKQIAGLLEQVAYLRGIYNEETIFRYAWNKDMYFGIRNDRDTEALQKALKIESVYAGPITGNFFSATEQAVIVFQKKHGIEPASGYAGPRTRAKLNSIFSP